MLLRIFHFLLFVILVRSGPSVIDRLTIQLRLLPEEEELSTPSPTPLPLESPFKKTMKTVPSTTTTTTMPLPSGQSSSKNPECPGIICFTMTSQNGSTIFDCTTNEPPLNVTIMHQLDCNYWQPPKTPLIPITAKFFDSESKAIPSTVNHTVPLRIVVKPRTKNPGLKVAADSMVPGALARLVKAVRQHVSPQFDIPIKLSLILVQIRRMSYEDLADLSMASNISGLILWNPEHLEETAFLQDADKASMLLKTYVRLTFYCETANDSPAFGRLWLPWLRWQVKFRQCRGHYTCYRWPPEDPLCCSLKRCPETPTYVVTHNDKLANRNPMTSAVRQQQVLDFDSCEAESDLTTPLVDLKRRDSCWSIPGSDELETTLQHTDPITTMQILSTTMATSAVLLNTSAGMSSNSSTVSTVYSSLQQEHCEKSLVSQVRIRNLIIGIICLLTLNLITFSCLVVACCWAWRKRSIERVESYDVSGSYEKQDTISFETAATTLIARNDLHRSYDHTRVMGSRDALLSASSTTSSVGGANGLPRFGLTSIRITQSNESLPPVPPHAIVIEG